MPFVARSQPFLTSDECKIVSEFERELLPVVNQIPFERAFRVFIFQCKKLHDQGVPDFFLCRPSVLRQRALPLSHQSSSVPRERSR